MADKPLESTIAPTRQSPSDVANHKAAHGGGASHPKRIQRKRTKGWRMPPNAVYVGRPTKWGNPYKPEDCDNPLALASGMPDLWAVEKFRQHAWRKMTEEPGWIESLRGKDLACWCPPWARCHAQVLLELANGKETRQ